MTTTKILSERVKEECAARGLSLRALAGKAGVSYSMLRRAVVYEACSPTIAFVDKLANAMDIGVWALLAPKAMLENRELR